MIVDTHLADELELLFLEETPLGLSLSKRAALEVASDSLVSAVAVFAQRPEHDPEVEAFLEQARQGERAVWRTETRTLIAQPSTHGLSVLVSEHVASAAHELANAMGGIMSAAHVALERPNARRSDYIDALEMINRLASTARGVARDLLGTRSDHEIEPADAAEVAADVAQLLADHAAARGVTLRLNETCACPTKASRPQLFSIIWNLVHNAIEILPPGGNASLETTRRGDSVQITVRDDGPGMSAEQQAKIFESYYTTRDGGTGLGLPLVKRILTALDGSIEVHSSLGSGATFVAALPAGNVRSERITAVRAVPLHDLSVLIIEDDENLREMLTLMLGRLGADVVAVASAAEAENVTARFTLAIADLMLGSDRGDDLLMELLAKGQVEHGLMTHGGDPPPGSSAARLRWLRKPFDADELSRAIHELREPQRRIAEG